MKMREQQTRQVNFNTLNAERRKQMMLAAEMMETMAIAMNVEVDKSGSGAIPEEAIRKAETIEKLARIIKEKMKLTVGPDARP
jgi:hypothetical protein